MSLLVKELNEKLTRRTELLERAYDVLLASERDIRSTLHPPERVWFRVVLDRIESELGS